VAALMLSRSFARESLSGPALLIVLVGSCIFLCAMSKNTLKQSFVTSLAGIAGVFLLTSTRFDSLEALAENPLLVLGALVLGVVWSVLCGQISKVDKTASALNKKEFSHLPRLTSLLPAVLLAVAVVRVLFL
jgi:hypothetical protein